MKVHRPDPGTVLRHGANPRPFMRGRYLIRSPLSCLVIWLIDRVLALRPKKRAPIPAAPARILIANWAHFGDVVLAMPALAALRAAFPAAEIGFLTSGGAQRVLIGTGLFDHLHVIDHPMIDRGAASRWRKILRFRRMRRSALGDIRRIGYDAAIDLYQHFPPASPVFHAAGIPIRIGFESAGFGPLLTHAVPWRHDDRPMMDHHRDVLRVLAPNAFQTPLIPVYPGHPRRPVPPDPGLDEDYVIVHTGSGGLHKEWPEENWAVVIGDLARGGHSIVLTGTGARERARIDRLSRIAPDRITVFADRDWEDFVALVARARHILSVDSAIVHIAAAFARPTTVIWSGTNDFRHWGPVNPQARIILGPVDCSPCHRGGCAQMFCIRDITAERVLTVLNAALSREPMLPA